LSLLSLQLSGVGVYTERSSCVTASSREKVLELEKELETLRLNLENVQQSNLKVNIMKARVL
jgi:hypothetical protein